MSLLFTTLNPRVTQGALEYTETGSDHNSKSVVMQAVSEREFLIDNLLVQSHISPSILVYEEKDRPSIQGLLEIQDTDRPRVPL